MIVYHGTDKLSAQNIINNGIDVTCGDESVDNGKGFYMTPNFEFALQRAKTAARRKSKFNETTVYPAVLKIELDINAVENISVKEFKDCSFEWKEFIFYNRIGMRFINKWGIETDNHNLDCKYDVVIDETADNDVTSIITKFRYKKDISRLREEISKIKKSNSVHWDKQISIHSEESLACISSIEIYQYKNKAQKGMI